MDRLPLRNDGSRRAPGNDAQQIVPSADHTARVPLDQFFQRDGHFLLHGARIIDMAGDVEELGSVITYAPERGKPRSTSAANCLQVACYSVKSRDESSNLT